MLGILHSDAKDKRLGITQEQQSKENKTKKTYFENKMNLEKPQNYTR